jgi:hypothetical protein
MDAVDNNLLEAPSSFSVPLDPSDPILALPHVRRYGKDGPPGGFRPRTDFLPNSNAPTAVPLLTEQDYANEDMAYQRGQIGKKKVKYDTKDDPNIPDFVKGGATIAGGWANTFSNMDHHNEQRCAGCLLWFSAALSACPSCETPASNASTNGVFSATQETFGGTTALSGAPLFGSTMFGAQPAFTFGGQHASSAGTFTTQPANGFSFVRPVSSTGTSTTQLTSAFTFGGLQFVGQHPSSAGTSTMQPTSAFTFGGPLAASAGTSPTQTVGVLEVGGQQASSAGTSATQPANGFTLFGGPPASSAGP